MARVLLETAVPHLDRPFDYLVPPALDDAARPGSRVTVRFAGRTASGWLLERTADPSTGARLTRLESVSTRLPPLTPEVLATARAVAARQAGTVADVLRAAVPPRVASVEREVLAALAAGPVADHPAGASGGHVGDTAEAGAAGTPAARTDGCEAPPPEAGAWARLEGGRAFVAAVLAGDGPRAAAVVPSRVGEWDEAEAAADLAATVAGAGGGVLVVVPDHRDLDRLDRALRARPATADAVRVGSDDGNTPRYRAHLRALTGLSRVAAGTRAAAWTPVQDLRLIILWGDDDPALAEPRAPYFHTREVVLERARRTGCAVLIVGPSRSLPVQRLVDSGWLLSLEPERAERRRRGPRVLASADSWESGRDPFARRARLPQAAWAAARDGLSGAHPGPVLVQVARTGFIPAVVCDRCRTPARCRVCSGPLSFRDRAAAARGELACRWCGTRERAFRCHECGSTAVRAGARGVDRTAEELGRGFPQVPVLSSSSEHRLVTVGAEPALVVATVGAEPHAPGGYAAALLLDGDQQLQREGLDVPGRVLSRWLAAAALVRPADQGGVVVVTAEDDGAVGALVRRDPVGYAAHTLAERRELRLPPAGRLAEVSGPAAAVAEYLELVEAARHERRPSGAPTAPLPWIGPVPDPADEQRHRALLLFPYAASEETVAALRAARSAASARREQPPVRVRLDPSDVL